MQGEMGSLIKTEAELALMTIMDNGFRHDPWLWDLEWKIASQKTIKGRLMRDVHSAESDIGLLFEDGYPSWYQDLVERMTIFFPHLTSQTLFNTLSEEVGERTAARFLLAFPPFCQN